MVRERIVTTEEAAQRDSTQLAVRIKEATK
jgi:hypothetical protein